MATIDILLAAYNGEKFISQQIDSILEQTFQDFNLIIRDDESQDRTPEIIESYARKYPDKIRVIHDDAICKDSAKNFFQLLKYATADYVMFSDQDDYWLPYKIQITLDYMKNCERDNPGLPVCMFTGLTAVDAELNQVDRFVNLGLKKSRYEFKTLLYAFLGAGYTQMINKKLYENIGEYDSLIDFHDKWIGLYAASCGVFYQIPMSLILYRRHDNNVTHLSVQGGGLY